MIILQQKKLLSGEIRLTLLLPWAYIYTHIKFPRTAMGVAIYARVEKSLYKNRLFIGHLQSVAYQAISTTLPKVVVVVLYIGFQFGSFYSREYSSGYQNRDPKVEVQCLVAYHYSPMWVNLDHNNPSGNCKAPRLPPPPPRFTLKPQRRRVIW